MPEARIVARNTSVLGVLATVRTGVGPGALPVAVAADEESLGMSRNALVVTTARSMNLPTASLAEPETRPRDIDAMASMLAMLLLASCGGQEDPGPTGTGSLSEAGVTGRDAATSCGPVRSEAGTGSAGAIAATFETVKLVLGGGGGIMPCAAAPCHGVNGAAPPSHPLELPPTDDQKLYTTLMSYVSTACNGTKLVEPCDPSRSALVSILKGPCGTTPRMPYGCTKEAGDCIPDEYIAAVEQWIANGASQP